MATITLKAHFDGERIILDEPVVIPEGALLLVTVVDDSTDLDAARIALSRAYGPDEPEYTDADVIRR